MNPQIVMLIIEAVGKLIALKNSGAINDVKAEAEALIAKLRAGLPQKDDGTPWTDDDIVAAAAAARLPWQRILDLTGGR